MNKSIMENGQPEQMTSNELKANNSQVSPAIGNTNVMRSLVMAKDLRIGNFVFGVGEFQGTALPICSLHSDNTLRLLVGEKSIGCFYADAINPIELDREWLEIFGFKQYFTGEGESYVEYFDHSKLTICNWGNGFIMSNPFAHGIRVELKYVHQLQNLFFAAIGKELECVK